MNVLVSISYCAMHGKGRDPDVAPRLHGETHARWLLDAVNYYLIAFPYIVVSATAWPGILNVENSTSSCERDVMWEVARRAVILGVPDNPGHAVGAALCIRQGLEAAGKWGYDCLLHTAEDIVPGPLVVARMVAAIEGGAEYVGGRWGVAQDELNTQFFACRPGWLCSQWDSCRVPSYGTIERYMATLLEGKPKHLLDEGYYLHTHDYETWQLWINK